MRSSSILLACISSALALPVRNRLTSIDVHSVNHELFVDVNINQIHGVNDDNTDELRAITQTITGIHLAYPIDVDVLVRDSFAEPLRPNRGITTRRRLTSKIQRHHDSDPEFVEEDSEVLAEIQVHASKDVVRVATQVIEIYGRMVTSEVVIKEVSVQSLRKEGECMDMSRRLYSLLAQGSSASMVSSQNRASRSAVIDEIVLWLVFALTYILSGFLAGMILSRIMVSLWTALRPIDDYDDAGSEQDSVRSSFDDPVPMYEESDRAPEYEDK